ncbi:hypothetical protein Pcinc_008666 [Petrolisthes cinctipes]|uniref:Uncharacterized protein n=1 Tax=Petrolisthes cinctipes TaxID=88211 RepID=A0AAE1G8F0_PETCI|nr:hypothetical protein Pcinc_008666 [Petrolisthes cinctipes]
MGAGERGAKGLREGEGKRVNGLCVELDGREMKGDGEEKGGLPEDEVRFEGAGEVGGEKVKGLRDIERGRAGLGEEETGTMMGEVTGLERDTTGFRKGD